MNSARIAGGSLLFAASLFAQDQPALSVLKTACVSCHNSKLKMSGLVLESRDAILTGGKRGAAAQPGAPDASLIIRAVEQSADLKMPPGGRLKDDQIASLREWIRQGMVWPAEEAKAPAGRDHWSFIPPQRPVVPEVKDAAWVRNPVDNFILARLEQQGVKPSAEADRYTLLRRLSLDLTGLPPTAAEIRDFLSDTSPAAYEKAVDRLLASPHYGERQARHWLDLARYADSDGYTIDSPRQIWKYRDWVIDALNRDLPFDRFVIEQIAGDLLPNPTTSQLIATGFHRNTPINSEGGIDFEQYRVEAVADRVATTGAVFLGLTIGCARCHDHKFDPISQRDFYQLFAFFNSADEVTTEAERSDIYRPVLELPTSDEIARREEYQVELNSVSRELAAYVKTLAAQPAGSAPKYKDAGLAERVAKLREVRKRQPTITSTLIMRDLPKPRESYIHLAGDFLRHGAPVVPGVPAVLSSKPVTGTRLDLARWLVDPSNPLTARVTVNRMWQALFGSGIVETENDFGMLGAKPTHPELLDWLATEFVARGWSQKAMHRLIVTSAAYRQSSHRRPDLKEIEPFNRLFARQARIRLEAEILRDAALCSSGLLTSKVGGASVYPPIPDGAMAVTQVKRPWPTATGPDRYRRGMYTFFYRSIPHPGLALFDAPDATTACTRRIRSNSPLQALTLLNDEAYVEFAQALAARVVKEVRAKDDRIDYAFLLALGRKPMNVERERLARFLALQRDELSAAENPELAAWTQGARVLFNLDDFMTRE
jgi:hypothetical protein